MLWLTNNLKNATIKLSLLTNNNNIFLSYFMLIKIIINIIQKNVFLKEFNQKQLGQTTL